MDIYLEKQSRRPCFTTYACFAAALSPLPEVRRRLLFFSFEIAHNNAQDKTRRERMFGVGILLQRLVVVAFFAALVAGLCWYDENIKLQVLSLKTEALIFFVGRYNTIPLSFPKYWSPSF